LDSILGLATKKDFTLLLIPSNVWLRYIMKYFYQVIAWMIGWELLFFSSSAHMAESIDPADDLSLTLHHFPHAEVYHLMSESRVNEIFSDRLDLFPQSQIPRLSRHFLYLCKEYRLDPAFVLSLIEVESGFHVKAVSSVRALGLMQVMLPTANFVVKKLGVRFSGQENFQGSRIRKTTITPKMLVDPFINLSIGISYLAWLRDYYRGSSYYILAAYNLGPARLDELRAQKSFRPTGTKKYYEAIRKNVSGVRFYRKVVPHRKKALKIDA
jgi:soluble lytic murein transglycosylase-like protein